MLRRVNAALYRERSRRAGSVVRRQQGNGSVETAKFEYNDVVLPTESIRHPGCTFTLVGGIHQFECIVVFNPSSATRDTTCFK